ncbi:ketopantoate reductase family protein [Anaerocolumna sp. MB42-C2]|uniref:ketopantoate reductase family protein n=1 Tax=Anaerocolumna sp. MB42-C2 TaxID=3070997 RepID=UPI0027E0D0A2|nr:2-dehydropantoate 2-reductase N-terminal domain-containing protein [Anaerocolumna sp. MB42-C2]WMJ89178.1 2-dehydropantoate 2-reductase N-terminal domain-containing protein [Anaerocolumna sp. MB42-C2]
MVFGAGPLGSLMAARLVEAGKDVTLLARGKRLEDYKKYGIVLEDEVSGVQTVTPIKLTDSFGAEDEYDLVMVVMRKNQVGQILPMLAANKKVPVFLFMMNNAVGPGDFISLLGQERVMTGFPAPGGERVGHIIRHVPVDENTIWSLPIGEVNGIVKDRTRQVAELLSSMRGYKVQIRQDMDNWHKYHVAVLMPAFAPALLAAKVKMKRMGRTRDLVVLGLRGIKEAFRALEKCGIPVTPRILKSVYWVPEPVMVMVLSKMLISEKYKSSIEGHMTGGYDEIKHLTYEIMPLIRKSGVPTPSIDSLLPYYEDKGPEIPEGSKSIPMKWGGVMFPLLTIAVLIGLLIIL